MGEDVPPFQRAFLRAAARHEIHERADLLLGWWPTEHRRKVVAVAEQIALAVLDGDL